MVLKLEDYRKEKIGVVTHSSENRTIHSLYHGTCQRAFSRTMESLQMLENPPGGILNGTPCDEDEGAVITWFIALENFINTILFIVCAKKNLSYESYKTKDLGDKINSILQLSGVDIKNFKKETKIQKKIHEYCFVRNKLLHQNPAEKGLKIEHTLFSPEPFRLNQIDVMQGLLICIEFFNIFSDIFEECSLMPQITIPINGTIDHIALDELYDYFIKPYFLQCLKKHEVSTDLSLEIEKSTVLIDLLPKVETSIKFVNDCPPTKNTTITNIASFVYQEFINKKFRRNQEIISSSHFTVPNYTRRNKVNKDNSFA